jgi:hypothetical protein
LGLTLTSNFSWRNHILNLHQKASNALNTLKRAKYKLDRTTLITIYKSHVRPLMEYADVIWDGCSIAYSNLLESIQYEAARIVRDGPLEK